MIHLDRYNIVHVIFVIGTFFFASMAAVSLLLFLVDLTNPMVLAAVGNILNYEDNLYHILIVSSFSMVFKYDMNT